MKYWFYSEGSILGPYAPAELLALPAFGNGCLVCPETSTGDNPGDWRAAEQVEEIAEALSVGVSGALVADCGAGLSGVKDPGGPAAPCYDAGTGQQQPYGYENLLDTLDNILGAYKNTEDSPPGKSEPDYELMNRFDIRLARIQEELEAARWEKNLLLEKIRLRETEERQNRTRIAELEEQLKEAARKAEVRAEKNAHDALLRELSPKTGGAAPSGEESPAERIFIGKRTAPLPESEPAPADGPAQPEKTRPAPASAAPKALKKLRPISGQEPPAETAVPAAAGEKNAAPAAPFDFRETALPAASAHGPAPSEDAAVPRPPARSAAVSASSAAPSAPAPAPQADGVVFDFGVIKKQSAESEAPERPAQPGREEGVQAFHITPGVHGPSGTPQAQVRDTLVAKPSQQNDPGGQFQAGAWPSAAPQDATLRSAAVPEVSLAAADPAADAAAGASDNRTVRVSLPGLQKQNGAVKPGSQFPRKGRGRKNFVLTLAGFGAVASLALGIFFLGDGNFSEFSMLNFGSAKEKSAGGPGSAERKAPADAGVAAQSEPAAPAKPIFEAASNESTRKAIETVKGYRLPGGRGSMESWFANSFLSNSARGSNEEWTATILHGDIFVVQYRLLRLNQEPLIYQFEVDVAKGAIVRGINNNAIELLEAPAKPLAKKPAPPPVLKPRKPLKPAKAKPRGFPQLPLPDAPVEKRPREYAPTGFETSEYGRDEKVRYLVAQESDEELF